MKFINFFTQYVIGICSFSGTTYFGLDVDEGIRSFVFIYIIDRLVIKKIKSIRQKTIETCSFSTIKIET